MFRKESKDKRVLQTLQDEFEQKLQLMQQLRRENVELQCKHELLLSLCNIFKVLRQQTSFSSDVTTASEQLLLEQLSTFPLQSAQPCSLCPSQHPSSSPLTATGGSSSGETISRAAAAQCSSCTNNSSDPAYMDSRCSNDEARRAARSETSHLETAAPASDPLYSFRRAVCQQQSVDDEYIPVSLDDLRADALKTVRELSYLLHLHETGTYHIAYASADPEHSDAVQHMRAELRRHYRYACQVLFGANSEPGVGMLYVATPYDGPSRAVVPQDVNLKVYLHTVQQLDLTMEQVDRILLGAKAFKGIMDSINNEVSNLQQEVAADTSDKQQQQQQQPGGCSSPDAGIASTAADMMSSFSTLYKHLGSSNQRASRLTRLNILLNKMFLMRSALLGYVFGCMTVPQCAKAFISVSPYPLIVTAFCTAVGQLKQQLQEQQQQQSKESNNKKPPVLVCAACAAKLTAREM